MQQINVLPKDIHPGDILVRVTNTLDMVDATVVEVKKVRRFEHTVYKIYLDQSGIPAGQEGWAEHRHLSPFILQPRNRVDVRREDER